MMDLVGKPHLFRGKDVHIVKDYKHGLVVTVDCNSDKHVWSEYEFSCNFKPIEYTIEPEENILAGGKRFNKGKVPLELVPASLNFAVAKVLQKGAEKYEPHNWERGMSWTTVMGCLERHWMKFKNPRISDLDDETGLNHLYHVACNVTMLIEYLETHPELDDRFDIMKEKQLDGSGITESDLDKMEAEHLRKEAETPRMRKMSKEELAELRRKADEYYTGNGTDCI